MVSLMMKLLSVYIWSCSVWSSRAPLLSLSAYEYAAVTQTSESTPPVRDHSETHLVQGYLMSGFELELRC